MSTDQWTIKDRPKSLDEVFGQPAATAFVRGLIKSKSYPSCLIISGPSGTGKTTLGLIIAAILSGWKGDPDKNPDLVQMPANVDRGIDDVRTIIQRSKYSPQGGKRRVMLVDEVQGLVGPAASAMLKVVEEPAPRTTWILCTDQPWKLNKAMLRRGQPINLGYISDADSIRAMQHVLGQHKIRLGKHQVAILKRLAAASYGVPGVSIQMLEHLCMVVRGGGSVSDALRAAVQNNPGVESFDASLAYIGALVKGDQVEAVKAVASCGTPDGMLELSNQMLAALIRVAVGGNPVNGLGWVVKKRIPVNSNDLSRLLTIQTKMVAALDINSRRVVPAESFLYSLSRQ